MFVTMDETASALVPADDWTLDEQGATQITIAGLDDKRNVTLVLTFSATKVLLRAQIIYEGKTDACHANFDFPDHLLPTHSESHWSTEETIIHFIEEILAPYMDEQRRALNLPATQWGLLSWDVFKAHTTQRVLDLLEARRIKPVYVPANCTGLCSANDHPEFNKNVKDLNKEKFTSFYAGKVEEKLANGEQEVFIQFPASEMKPLHAQWTADSLQYLATQQQWMENALRGVGLWDIFEGTFVPDPALEAEFFQPPVATTAEAAIAVPDTDSESEDEFVSEQSDQETEVDAQSQTELHLSEPEVEYNLEDEVELSDPEEPIQPKQTLKRRRTLLQDSEDEDMDEDVPLKSDTPMSKVASPVRGSRTSRNARAVQEEQEQLQEAIARSLVERDNEGILEEETDLFIHNMMQQGQWRIVYLNEPWQLAKRLLIEQSQWPKKFRPHPTQHSYIVPFNVTPKKHIKITGDGSCLFRCLSYAIFRNEDCHKEVRRAVLQHMADIWEEQPRVRLLASLWYQHYCKKQTNVRPSQVKLTAEQYVSETGMFRYTTWGGSTELEVAGQWLQTPIKVFYFGNPKFPPKSWITYGSLPCTYSSHTILLQWTGQRHYDFITEVM